MIAKFGNKQMFQKFIKKIKLLLDIKTSFEF